MGEYNYIGLNYYYRKQQRFSDHLIFGLQLTMAEFGLDVQHCSLLYNIMFTPSIFILVIFALIIISCTHFSISGLVEDINQLQCTCREYEGQSGLKCIICSILNVQKDVNGRCKSSGYVQGGHVLVIPITIIDVGNIMYQ